MGFAGSSPLTRGKQRARTDVGRRVRLIPAHAGKTASRDAHSSEPTAHPRSRGENLKVIPDLKATSGSSPLTRGKPVDSTTHVRLRGLIPAHAGKTRNPAGAVLTAAAHPRSRGENSTAATSLWRLLGSSPLTRGKHPEASDALAQGRLIPAHAGKTHGCYRVASAHAAHPRSRGENSSTPSPP